MRFHPLLTAKHASSISEATGKVSADPKKRSTLLAPVTHSRPKSFMSKTKKLKSEAVPGCVKMLCYARGVHGGIHGKVRPMSRDCLGFAGMIYPLKVFPFRMSVPRHSHLTMREVELRVLLACCHDNPPQ